MERRGDFKGSREPRSHADRAARADPNLADQSHVTDCDITHPPTCFNPVFLPHTLVTSRQILDGILHYWHQVCHYREYPIYTTTFTYAHIHPHSHILIQIPTHRRLQSSVPPQKLNAHTHTSHIRPHQAQDQPGHQHATPSTKQDGENTGRVVDTVSSWQKWI